MVLRSKPVKCTNWLTEMESLVLFHPIVLRRITRRTEYSGAVNFEAASFSNSKWGILVNPVTSMSQISFGFFFSPFQTRSGGFRDV